MKWKILTGVAALGLSAALAQTVTFESDKTEAISVIEQSLLLINEDCNCEIVLQNEMDTISLTLEFSDILEKKYNINPDSFSCFQRFPLQKGDFTSKRIKLADYQGIEKVQEKNTQAPSEKVEMTKLLAQCK